MATRFVLQERQIGYVSNDDDSESLYVALQRQNHFVYGQVKFSQLTETIFFGDLFGFRLTLRLSCAMNFMIYPHDTQECKLQMESRKSFFLLSKFAGGKFNFLSVAYDRRYDFSMGSRRSAGG